MKRLCIVLLILVLTLSLAGCGEQGPVYAVDRYGNEYTIDREQGTISDGTHTYEYTYEGDSEDFWITIEYPNGGRYQYSQSNGVGTGSRNARYSENFYPAGDLLADVLRDNLPKRGSVRNVFAAIVVAGLGIFYLLSPETAWYISYGWRYRDAEPSDAALVFARISGGIAIVIGIILMLC